MNAHLEIDGLEMAYGSQSVLKNLTMSVSKGETVAIIGRSGVGKSTLLKALALIEMPKSGILSLDGQEYYKNGQFLFEPWEVRRNIGLVFQDFKLFPAMTAKQNILFPLRKIRAIKGKEANIEVEEVMFDLGIVDVAGKYPNQLSGGQAQRCALARAIVLEPKVLLLDEITSALDPATIVDVTSTLRGLRESRRGGELTIVLVTHLMHFAETFADRIVFLDKGRILAEGPAKGFLREAHSDEVRRFVMPLREVI